MEHSPNALRMTRRAFVAAAGASLAACRPTTPPRVESNADQTSSPEAQTRSGRVAGERLEGVKRFLGIPYAQSIAGRNRFAPPRPVVPWEGVRQAVRYAPSSPQQPERMKTPVTPAFAPPDYVEPGDDCLALNVWAPGTDGDSVPVMVWLHGGGFVSGSGSCAVYDGERLASRGDVVVVTINHRLAASGFTDFSRILGGDFAASANLSVRDMVAALEWVRDNIAAFGGDPSCVTIFGESGGGWKVSTLLATPAAAGLFHRAIIESGPLTQFLSPAKADEIAHAVLAELRLTPSTADALHDISADQLLAAEARVLAGLPMGTPGFPSGFWPVLDGEVLPVHAFDPEAAPTSLGVPLLVGQTGTEFTLFMLNDEAAYSLDDAQLEARVEKLFGAEEAPRLLASYRRDFPDYDPSGIWFRLYSDYAMGTLSVTVLDARAIAGSAPVYAYRFDWQTPILNGRLYSPHTIEIPFVFDNTAGPGSVMTGNGPDVAALAQTVSSAWVEFARTGVPAAKGLPAWPPYTLERRESMHLDTTSSVAPYMDPALVSPLRALLDAR